MSQDSIPTLYRLSECPQLMSDACLCDESKTLLFLSVWGRDTAIQELLARLTLTSSEDRCLREICLLDEADVAANVTIGDIERFQKRMTRVQRRTLFGPMLHLWLIDKRCLSPDRANATALIVMPRNSHDRVRRLWAVVRETCPVPLLDHWCDTVLHTLVLGDMLSKLPTVLGGRLDGYRLAIDVPALTLALSEMIRTDRLGITSTDLPQQEPLQLVA